MSAALIMDQGHDLDKASNVQRIRRRVKANIARRHFLVQRLLCSRHEIVDHPSPAQFFNEILYHLKMYVPKIIRIYRMSEFTADQSRGRRNAGRDFQEV